LDLAAESFEILQEEVEARGVPSASIRAAVPSQVECEDAASASCEGFGERFVAPAVLGEAVDEEDSGAWLRGLPAPIPEANAPDADEGALAPLERPGAHPCSFRIRSHAIINAACAARSRTSPRSPVKRKSSASLPGSAANPIQTVPTGFRGDPPPGPAIPVTERP